MSENQMHNNGAKPSTVPDEQSTEQAFIRLGEVLAQIAGAAGGEPAESHNAHECNKKGASCQRH